MENRIGMRRMLATPRKGLTPAIGISLAVVVAASLVALAFLAQRVSLPSASSSPVSLNQISQASDRPLVVGGHEREATSKDRTAARKPGQERVVEDTVLPMRISHDRGNGPTWSPTRSKVTADRARHEADQQQAPTGGSDTAIRGEMEVRDTHDDKGPKEKHEGKALGQHKDHGKGHKSDHGHDD